MGGLLREGPPFELMSLRGLDPKQSPHRHVILSKSMTQGARRSKRKKQNHQPRISRIFAN